MEEILLGFVGIGNMHGDVVVEPLVHYKIFYFKMKEKINYILKIIKSLFDSFQDPNVTMWKIYIY